MRRIAKGERVKLPRVNRVRRGGVVHKYHRPTGIKLPSDVPEGHPSFIAAWTKAESQERPLKSPTGTIGAGAEAYLASQGYKTLSDGYRPVIRRHIDAIRKTWASAKMADLRARHIEHDLEGLRPAVARSRRKAWRKLCPFWKAKGWIDADPSAAVPTPALQATEGHKEWTPDDLAQYRNHWPTGTPQRRACELLQWTGARASDVVKLGRGMVDKNGLLIFQQAKTGNVAMVPWVNPILGMDNDHAHLMAEIQDCTDMLYLLTKWGKPRSVKAFSAWFSETCRDAGLSLSAHGLRKYRLNQIAEAGGSVLQLQTWGGHVTIQEVEHYTRRANRTRAMLEQSENPANQIRRLQTGRKNL